LPSCVAAWRSAPPETAVPLSPKSRAGQRGSRITPHHLPASTTSTRSPSTRLERLNEDIKRRRRGSHFPDHASGHEASPVRPPDTDRTVAQPAEGGRREMVRALNLIPAIQKPAGSINAVFFVLPVVR
jgi:hypothetical protein